MILDTYLDSMARVSNTHNLACIYELFLCFFTKKEKKYLLVHNGPINNNEIILFFLANIGVEY